MSKADSAKSAVSAALAFLQEHTNGEQLRRELDIQLPGTPQHKDQDALRQAMQQVNMHKVYMRRQKFNHGFRVHGSECRKLGRGLWRQAFGGLMSWRPGVRFLCLERG